MSRDRPDDPEGPDPDRAWQEIVDHYGERPALPEEPGPEKPGPDAVTLRPLFRDRFTRPEPPPAAAGADDDGADDYGADEEDRFVPPEPPPVPTPAPLRRAAWFGLLGVPTLFVVLTLLGLAPPRAITVLLILWFAGGFGYLVATMRRGPDDGDGWDNGAVV